MSTDTTSKRYSEDLLCYRDTDDAEAVCGECGRPVCGPVMNATVRGILSGLFSDYGHGKRFHDATFHSYENGVGRALLTVGLLGISVLFSAVAPGLIPAVVSATISAPIGLKPAVVQSSAVLGLASLLTLRYQRGERTTEFRVRVRRTASRVLCDECFENSLVQLALSYVVTAVVSVLIVFALLDVVSTGSALPLRIAALGVGLRIVGDDIVAYLMSVVGTDGDETEHGAVQGSETGSAGQEPGPDIGFESDPPPVSDEPTAED